MLPIAEALNNWVQDLIAFATQQAVEGKQWAGYKLVAGRTVRKYTSEAEVIKACTDAGYTDIYKTSLLGVGCLLYTSAHGDQQFHVLGQLQNTSLLRSIACIRKHRARCRERCLKSMVSISL